MAGKGTSRPLILSCILAIIALSGACADDSTEALPPLEAEIFFGPPALTSATEALFEFRCNRTEGCDFVCALNVQRLMPCTSPVSFENLAGGEHTFTVVARDQHRERSEPAVWQWTVDPIPPFVVDLTGPGDPTAETTATFHFACSVDSCQFACALNGEEPIPCESGIRYQSLEDGEHVFSVAATNEAGITGPRERWTWTVDTLAPAVRTSEDMTEHG
jgi:hypothetical protein